MESSLRYHRKQLRRTSSINYTPCFATRAIFAQAHHSMFTRRISIIAGKSLHYWFTGGGGGGGGGFTHLLVNFTLLTNADTSVKLVVPSITNVDHWYSFWESWINVCGAQNGPRDMNWTTIPSTSTWNAKFFRWCITTKACSRLKKVQKSPWR